MYTDYCMRVFCTCKPRKHFWCSWPHRVLSTLFSGLLDPALWKECTVTYVVQYIQRAIAPLFNRTMHFGWNFFHWELQTFCFLLFWWPKIVPSISPVSRYKLQDFGTLLGYNWTLICRATFLSHASDAILRARQTNIHYFVLVSGTFAPECHSIFEPWCPLRVFAETMILSTL